jgi:hypothetical protein
VQLVVERADSPGDGDVLRHLSQLPGVLGRAAEDLGEARCELVAAREAVARRDRQRVHAGPEHEDEPPADESLRDRIEMVAHSGRCWSRSKLQTRVVAQDGREQLLKGTTRLDAELLDQDTARLVVGVQRLSLPRRAIEGEHELPAQALPERMLRDERLQLTDQVGVSTELEVRGNSFLERNGAQLFQPANLRLGERLEGEVGKRRPAPEG